MYSVRTSYINGVYSGSANGKNVGETENILRSWNSFSKEYLTATLMIREHGLFGVTVYGFFSLSMDSETSSMLERSCSLRYSMEPLLSAPEMLSAMRAS
jgi:hypothetical protein